MQKRTFLAAGVAAIAAAVGLITLGGRATAQNVTLEALSGSALASDPETVVVDIRRPEEWKETGVIEGALLIKIRHTREFPASRRATSGSRSASGVDLSLWQPDLARGPTDCRFGRLSGRRCSRRDAAGIERRLYPCRTDPRNGLSNLLGRCGSLAGWGA